MDDWRKKIDAKLERENIEKERKRKSEEDEHNKELQRIYNAKLKELQLKFRCHVCGKKPSRPSTYSVYQGDYYTGEADDWDIPGDLDRCSICNKWTCVDDGDYQGHLYKNICCKHAT